MSIGIAVEWVSKVKPLKEYKIDYNDPLYKESLFFSRYQCLRCGYCSDDPTEKIEYHNCKRNKRKWPNRRRNRR